MSMMHPLPNIYDDNHSYFLFITNSHWVPKDFMLTGDDGTHYTGFCSHEETGTHMSTNSANIQCTVFFLFLFFFFTVFQLNILQVLGHLKIAAQRLCFLLQY